MVAAFVSPDATVRLFKELVGDERSIEVFVDTPIEVCRRRDNSDSKRADAGEIADFPGVSAPYDHEEADLASTSILVSRKRRHH